MWQDVAPNACSLSAAACCCAATTGGPREHCFVRNNAEVQYTISNDPTTPVIPCVPAFTRADAGRKTMDQRIQGVTDKYSNVNVFLATVSPKVRARVMC